jgi:flagellar basal-body rod modification protein FlgD
MDTIEGVASADWTPAGSDAAAIEAALSAVGKQDATPGGSLGKNEFLNLLVTQLSSQDPLNPMDSSESIAQLAQFSALEQMQNLNGQIEAMRKSSGLVDAMLIQDQNVELTLNNGTQVKGVVENMTWQDGDMILQINGQAYPMAKLSGMRLLGAGDPTSLILPAEEDAEEDAIEQPNQGETL